MKAIRTVLACIRKADQMYNLINHGDKILIGLSGGKDSVALTYALSLYQKFSHTDFVIQPVILDLGFPGFDPTPMRDFCESLGLKLMVVDNTEVYKILTIQQKDHEHLPCSICSRMKKASMNKIANEIGFNKVSFAHHADDAIETYMMNTLFGGRVIRDGIVVYEGKLASLQREKDLVKEVKNGYECGMLIENFNDIKEGDIIENFEMVEQKD